MNFGEILEPSSRAFWDGFEEEELPEEAGGGSQFLQKPEWTWFTKDGKPDYPEEILMFVITEGTGISEFIKKAIVKETPAKCKLQKGSVSVYHFVDQKLVLCVSEENDLNLSGAATEILVPWISIAKTVLTLSIQSKVLYKGTDCNEQIGLNFIRGINSLVDGIDELQTPNFITGVSAGVAYWRTYKGLGVSSYVVYMDSPDIDALSTEPILKLLNKLGVKCDNKYISKCKDQSHLYM